MYIRVSVWIYVISNNLEFENFVINHCKTLNGVMHFSIYFWKKNYLADESFVYVQISMQSILNILNKVICLLINEMISTINQSIN